MLGERGSKVVVSDINEAGGQETVASIKVAGGQATFVAADVSRAADIKRLVSEALSTYGGINIVHGNAAIHTEHDTIEEVSEVEWRRVLDIGLTSLFLMAREVFPLMRRSGGVIINTSSQAAYWPRPRSLAYATAKAGVLALTRSLAALGEKDGIRANCVCPTGVDTPMLRQMAEDPRIFSREVLLKPSDVARAVAYLAAHDSMTGAEILVKLRDGIPTFVRMEISEGEELLDV